MANVVFQNAIAATFEGDLDWETATLHALLLMTNTNADSPASSVADTNAALTLDECNATGYTEETVTTPAVSIDDTDYEMEWTSDDWVFAGLSGDATRDYEGALLIKYVDGSTGDIPMIFVDFTTNVLKEATQVTVPPHATEGFFNVGQPA